MSEHSNELTEMSKALRAAATVLENLPSNLPEGQRRDIIWQALCCVSTASAFHALEQVVKEVRDGVAPGDSSEKRLGLLVTSLRYHATALDELFGEYKSHLGNLSDLVFKPRKGT